MVECGRVWVGSNNGKGCFYYICSGRRKCRTAQTCVITSIAARKIEPLIWDKLDSLLRQPRLILGQIEKQSESAFPLPCLLSIAERVEYLHVFANL